MVGKTVIGTSTVAVFVVADLTVVIVLIEVGKTVIETEVAVIVVVAIDTLLIETGVCFSI